MSSFLPLQSLFFRYFTLTKMTHLEGTRKCTLGLREAENYPWGEFLCIMGHYIRGLRATQPPLTKMRDQQGHFLPVSNGKNMRCMFRADAFKCSMFGNHSNGETIHNAYAWKY